jgi:hypothetical protein
MAELGPMRYLFLSVCVWTGILGCVSSDATRVVYRSTQTTPTGAPRRARTGAPVVLTNGVVVYERPGAEEVCFLSRDARAFVKVEDVRAIGAGRVDVDPEADCRVEVSAEGVTVEATAKFRHLDEARLLSSLLAVRTEDGVQEIPLRNIKSYRTHR